MVGSVLGKHWSPGPRTAPPAHQAPPPTHLPWQGCASPIAGGSLEIYCLEIVVVVVIIIRHLTGKIRIEGTCAVFFKWELNKRVLGYFK